MMTSDNYSTPRKYKVEPSDGHLFQKDGERKDTKSYIDDHTATASHSTDLCGAESADIGSPSSSNGRKARGRRSKDHVVDDATPISDDTPLAGATAQVTEKPKSLKKEKPIGSSSKKRKERKNLREKRRSTGVVIMPGADTEEKATEAKQTLQNTQQNENIGAEDFIPNPSEVTPTKPQRSSRIAHDDVDLDKRDKQDLIDLIEKLEKSLDQKSKEVETLKGENQKLRDDNNALLRVVNQVSSLKTK